MEKNKPIDKKEQDRIMCMLTPAPTTKIQSAQSTVMLYEDRSPKVVYIKEQK